MMPRSITEPASADSAGEKYARYADIASADDAMGAEKPAKKLAQPSIKPQAGPHASERYTYSPPDRGKLAPSSE
jgi:hypothetical protein